jgi:hypothetical protein
MLKEWFYSLVQVDYCTMLLEIAMDEIIIILYE